MPEAGQLTLCVKVDSNELDDATEKAKKLLDLLKEAKSLTDEMASRGFDAQIALEKEV